MILHWRTGLDRTDDFQKFCRSRLDRIQFYRIWTGLGLKIFTSRSSLLLTTPPQQNCHFPINKIKKLNLPPAVFGVSTHDFSGKGLGQVVLQKL